MRCSEETTPQATRPDEIHRSRFMEHHFKEKRSLAPFTSKGDAGTPSSPTDSFACVRCLLAVLLVQLCALRDVGVHPGNHPT